MDYFDPEAQFKNMDTLLKRLREIHGMLVKANQQNGTMEKHNAMELEVRQMGWEEICAKYHPDININDPAAFELFEWYKYIYSRMGDKQE